MISLKDHIMTTTTPRVLGAASDQIALEMMGAGLSWTPELVENVRILISNESLDSSPQALRDVVRNAVERISAPKGENVFELTLAGFYGGSDDTDSLVIWIGTPFEKDQLVEVLTSASLHPAKIVDVTRVPAALDRDFEVPAALDALQAAVNAKVPDSAIRFDDAYRYLEPVESRLVLYLPVTSYRPEAMRVSERKIASQGAGAPVWYEVETLRPGADRWIEQKSHPTAELAVADARNWYPAPETVAATAMESRGDLVGTQAWTTAVSSGGKPLKLPCTVTSLGDWATGRDGRAWRKVTVFLPAFNAGDNIETDAAKVFSDAECTRPVDVGVAPGHPAADSHKLEAIAHADTALTGEPEFVVRISRNAFTARSEARKGWNEAVSSRVNGWGIVIEEKHRAALIKGTDMVFFEAKGMDMSAPTRLEPGALERVRKMAVEWAQQHQKLPDVDAQRDRNIARSPDFDAF